jgi:hypothetical protein
MRIIVEDTRALQSRVSEYDQQILDITRELCVQLDIPNYNPTFVSWETLDSRVRGQVEFRYDECLIEKYCLTLSGRMKGVFEPDEWKPIIASSLIFSKKLRRRIFKVFVLSLVAFLLLAVTLYFGLPLLFPQPYTVTKNGSSQTSPVGYFVALPASLAMVPFGTILVSVTHARRLRRAADKKATDLVSSTAFLSSLNKIAETERATGYRENTNIRGPIPLLPNIRVRISSIKKSLEPKVDI